MNNKEMVLSTDFRVLLQIYKDTKINNEPVYFSKLLKETNLTEVELSKCMDKLYDRIMIDIQVVKLKNGSKVLGFEISENFIPFVKGIYNTIETTNEEEQTQKNI